MLKGAGVLPGWLTGKLSDFAGLFLLPVLLFSVTDAALRLHGRTPSRSRLAALSSLLASLGFGCVKLVPGVNAFASQLFGKMLLDPSDLVALPMAAFAGVWLARSRAAGAAPGWLRGLALAASSLACLATSPPMIMRAYPEWSRVTPRTVGCARLEIWVAKSGKEGIGVTVAARSVGSAKSCRLRVADAMFASGVVSVRAHDLPDSIELNDANSYLYLPFVFDNEALWNRSIEQGSVFQGSLRLGVEAGERPVEHIEVRLEQALNAAHRYRAPGAPPPPPPPPPLQMADPGLPLAPGSRDAGSLEAPASPEEHP